MSKYQGQGQNPPLWVSQNFLTSHKTIERLLRRTTIGRDDHVIEIGPGKGHTTRLLLGRCRKVTAVELDERLYQRLAETFRGAGNLRLCCRDFLQWRLPAGESYKVFANIPFCHTTGILRKLAQAEHIKLFCDVDKKHSVRFPGIDLATHIEWTEFYLADAIIISGRMTGDAPSLDKVREAKGLAKGRPILMGSGMTAENVADFFQYADGCIVGFGMKDSGHPERPVNPDKIKRFMEAAQRAR